MDILDGGCVHESREIHHALSVRVTEVNRREAQIIYQGYFSAKHEPY